MFSVTSALMISLYITSDVILVSCQQLDSEFYFKEKNNMKQTTQTLHTTQAPQTWNCGIYCNRKNDCKGFNYNPDTQECQLLVWPDNQTVVAEGYSVWFKRITCADQPCENGGTCRDRPENVPLYKCDCSQGWCGRRCQELHYNVTHKACIVGGDITFKTMSSAEECLRWCLQTAGCKSAGFGTLEDCHLEKNDHTTTSLSNCNTYDYYYPLKECNNEP
ncbi:uncharacterized protein LOC143224258 [Tachypleus tridentatus]|uniref:uncharacterized protein LOC143224258 n=1 Tax=Tachypleus tridentatus TaxID=6853 RepID=UPI003FD658A8